MTLWEKIKYFFGWRPEPQPEPVRPPAQPAPVVPPATPPDWPKPVSPGGQADSKPVEGGSTPPTGARTLGLDVAKYQDKLEQGELARLFKMGYRFIFAKATDGQSGVDAYFKLHRKNAKEQGFIVGPYHFFRFGYDPVGQARHLFKTVGGWLPGELPPVLDVEWDRFTANGKYSTGKRMDAAAVDRVYDCVKEIERLFGVKPIIYTNAYFWPEKIEKPERFQGYLCWIPSYSDSLNPRGVHHLADLSPAELALAGKGVKVPYPWKLWNFWQDDDDLAIGDVKAIDTNVFRGSLEELKSLTKKA